MPAFYFLLGCLAGGLLVAYLIRFQTTEKPDDSQPILDAMDRAQDELSRRDVTHLSHLN